MCVGGRCVCGGGGGGCGWIKCYHVSTVICSGMGRN